MVKCLLHLVILPYTYLIVSAYDVITEDTPLVERGPCISNPCLHDGLCTITRDGFICTCVDGYVGVRCERRSDDCPLDNSIYCGHGRCRLDMRGEPKCICNDGYEDVSCLIQTESCKTNPCLNGGSCADELVSYKCLCPNSTTGSHCQIDKDDLDKCLMTCDGYSDGGKCWNNESKNIYVSWGYEDLICNSKQSCFDASPNEWTGEEYMEVQLKPIYMQNTDNLVFITDGSAKLYKHPFIPHILPMEVDSRKSFITCNTTNAQPLTNDSSISQLHVNSSFLRLGTQYFLADINALYRCVFGLRLNVTVKTEECKKMENGKICSGRGKCFSDFNRPSYQCLCCEGFIGEYCEYEDPCSINPCVNNGDCKVIDYGDGVFKHTCVCPNGFHGDKCDLIYSDCASNPCHNDAVCHATNQDYYCECKLGFSGVHCEINENECSSIVCQHGGTCVDGLNSFFCECTPGFKGTFCEIDIDDCHSYPCIEGTCLDLVNDYNCVCNPGRRGRHCEFVLSECNSQPCINGKCIKEPDGFTCSCGVGYTGILCEIKLDLCKHSTFCVIENAKDCIDHGHNVSCHCHNGWSGDNCNVNIDDCEESKCMNGGSCIDKVSKYDCKCTNEYTGKFCEIAKFKEVSDIAIDFVTDDCKIRKNNGGIAKLESQVVDLINATCKCSFSRNLIRSTATRITCKDDVSGIFKTDLLVYDNDYLAKIICSVKKFMQTDASTNIANGIYFESIADDKMLCSTYNHLSDVGTGGNSNARVMIGILIGIIILIAALVLAIIKIRNIRRKVGVSSTSIKRHVTSFSNKAFQNDSTDVEETEFASRDSSGLPKLKKRDNAFKAASQKSKQI